MASSFKRIKLFQQDPIDQPNSSSSSSLSKQEQKTVQDVEVIHMIYLDMFFFFLGTPPVQPLEDGSMPAFATEYFYFTKNMQILNEYKIHTSTVYIDKFTRNGNKMIISLGRDINYTNLQQPEDMGWIFKIWDFNSLVGKSKDLIHLTHTPVYRLHTGWTIRSDRWIPQGCRGTCRHESGYVRRGTQDVQAWTQH
jgi:hypothetical protein